ncbi:OmpA family protein [Microvirga zambiensis]|uniref:OmpA family protein n=1 Tax=Microvirga zambiensis TaxID=1402137 RepID=UPI001FE633FC|nr:OmpA family protein [Microvirga zambiensis]
MKLSSLFLASAAIPLMLLPVHVSALPSASETPLVLAQAGPATDEELPPGARQRRQGQDGERGGRPGGERRQGGQDQGGQDQRGPGASEERGPRPPRGAGPGGPGPDDGPGRPRREQGPPAERPAPPAERPAPPASTAPANPARPTPPAPAERAQPPAETPARPQRPATQERERPPAERPRPQAPATPGRPAAPPPAAQPAAPPAPIQQQAPAERERPGRSDNTENPDRTRGQRPVQVQPVTPPAPPPAAAPPASRAQPTPPAPSAPFQQAPGQRPPQQAFPGRAAPLDPSQVRIDDLRRDRRERREGNRVIIEEPGNRTIIREGNQVIIRHDETERFRRTYRDADVRVERRGADEEYTVVRRPDGSEIVTVRDSDGNLIRRVRREAAGQEVVLIENRRGGIDRRPGYGYVQEDVVRLPPPVVRIPREEYIVDVEDASQEDLVEAFTAPPVDRIERSYTLDEVRRSQPLRERMRRVDVDTVTFEFGSWELAGDQAGALTGIAQAIRSALSRNPNEIFLIEGHTDAVGSDEDNLTLSDRRAETVATILSERFQIPAENLTTQGYGEQYLKVNTQTPERQNRRVAMRRITPLLQGQNQQ